jgi:hypothetical protein
MPAVSLVDPLLTVGPIWLVGLIMIVLCLLARELGSLLFRYVGEKPAEDRKDDKDDDSSDFAGTTFGLLAFVLAFTFSIALDRFDTRRTLVGEEANAIGTTYRRADLYDEPVRSQMQQTLREYAHTRIAPAGTGDVEIEHLAAQSRALREKFWGEARAAIYPVRDTERGSYMVEATNEMMELGNRREVAGRAHVPSRILDVSLVYLLICAGMLGFLRSKKGGARQGSTVVLVLFVFVLMLILDIDSPRNGTILVPQRAMEDMVQSLDALAAQPAPALASPVQQP